MSMQSLGQPWIYSERPASEPVPMLSLPPRVLFPSCLCQPKPSLTFSAQLKHTTPPSSLSGFPFGKHLVLGKLLPCLHQTCLVSKLIGPVPYLLREWFLRGIYTIHIPLGLERLCNLLKVTQLLSSRPEIPTPIFLFPV